MHPPPDSSDPAGDASLRISLREPTADGESFTESVWLVTGPNTFRLNRAKFAVADLTSDGKDDLVTLYDEGIASHEPSRPSEAERQTEGAHARKQDAQAGKADVGGATARPRQRLAGPAGRSAAGMRVCAVNSDTGQRHRARGRY